MRVLVCGSRTFEDEQMVRIVLDGMYHEHGTLTVIEGGARGADRFAGEWADKRILADHVQVPAQWEEYGKAAGPIRNQAMLDYGPELVLAFVDKPLLESRGTLDMVTRAEEAGIPTYVIEKLT
jgi:hypothetical protein